MLTKFVRFVLFLGLFLHLAGTSAFAEEPPITGITIDEELSQLLAQIVPYIPPEKYALPVESRFLFNLNKLINEDLATQDEKYKLAACKLALRQALAINKTVDSIEVRRYDDGRRYDYGRKYGLDVKENFFWMLGGVCDETSRNFVGYYDATIPLFLLNGGKITNVDTYSDGGYCDGAFGSCCGGGGYYCPGV